jgi:hypothetical protein
MTDEEVAKWIESESWIDANWDVRAGELINITTMRAVGFETRESNCLYYGEPIAKWSVASLDGVRFTISEDACNRLRSIRNRLLVTTKAVV